MKALYDLNDAELDDFIRRAKRSLAEHAAELRHSPAPGDVRAAMETIIGIMKELQVTRPAKRAAIDAVLVEYPASPDDRRPSTRVHPSG